MARSRDMAMTAMEKKRRGHIKIPPSLNSSSREHDNAVSIIPRLVLVIRF
jgi:hypothetical protein